MNSQIKQCTKCLDYLTLDDNFQLRTDNNSIYYLSKCRKCITLHNKLSRYKLTEAEYLQMLTEQDHKCKICQQSKPLHIDHDHSTGKVRGLLCNGCNSILGFANDKNDILMAAIRYLEDIKS